MFRKIKYIISTKRYYIITFTISILIISFCLLLSKDLNRSLNCLETFNNCTANFISYDRKIGEKDCVIYYGNDYSVSIKNDSNLLNCTIYQFIDNMELSDNFILCQKNIYKGEFTKLKKNEVALPSYYADLYNLNIEDSIYINNIKCIIKYFFMDVYDLYKIDYNSNNKIIFIGPNTLNLDYDLYLNFSPSIETHHFRIYNLNDIRMAEAKHVFIIITLIIITTIILTWLCSMFRYKALLCEIKKECLSGSRNINFEIIMNEIVYILGIMLLTVPVLFINYTVMSYLAILLGLIIMSIVNIIFINIKIRGVKYGK